MEVIDISARADLKTTFNVQSGDTLKWTFAVKSHDVAFKCDTHTPGLADSPWLSGALNPLRVGLCSSSLDSEFAPPDSAPRPSAPPRSIAMLSEI